MGRPSLHRAPTASIIWPVVLALAAFAAALAVAPASPAYPAYVHGGISPVACEVCHTDDHTTWPVTSEKCLTCHSYDAPDLPVTCWTCHTPGQDMSASRTDAACTATCHLPDGGTSLHTTHSGGGASCTTCHPVSPSSSEAGTDPHHVLPVPPTPAVSAFTPGTGAPGTTVTVMGSGFVKVIGVAFGGVRASTFVALSATQLTAVVPYSAASGPVTVFNAGGAGTSAASFIVPGRVAASLSIAAGPARLRRGARVVVSGSVKPAALGGAHVGLTFQYRSGSRWLKAGVLSVHAAPDGAYRCSWLPPRKALYRVRTTLEATAQHSSVHSAWVGFRVQ